MPKQMRGLLEQALHKAGIAAPIARQLPKQIWEAAVGREIAGRAQPTQLTCGVLHLLVQDHRWRDQLDAMRTELIARVNARLGKPMVRELRFGLAHAGALPERSGVRSHHAAGATALANERLAPALDSLAAVREGPLHLRCAERLGPELREAFLRAGHAAHRARAETA